MKPSNPEKELRNDIAGFALDPLGFVRFAFRWGGGELSGAKIEDWQIAALDDIGRSLREGTAKNALEAVQLAVASGHGIGKSAFVSWVILWAMSTFPDTKGVVTANTDTQLKTKTWPELGKWHRLSLVAHWFTYTATAIYSTDSKREKTWRFDAIPWSATNTEAFAGLHNKGKRIVLIFDEASAIDDKIWEVAEGALTDSETEIVWCAFGNPTRNTGRFRECFGSRKNRWNTRQIDSRTVSLTNKAQLQKFVDDNGEDSDFVRVRVRGEFPNVGDRQFIGNDIVAEARGKHLRIDQYEFAPVILTLDNAWYGGDEVVIGKRQGLAYTQLMAFRKNDNDMLVAGYMAKFEDEHKADAVFIDQGYGTGVASAGKELGRHWTLVPFAGASGTPGYLNKRAEMWGLAKDWLRNGGAIPNDATLCAELTGPEYEVKLSGDIKIESKDDMKKRGLSSPNRADALILSFAHPVLKKSDSSRAKFTSAKYDPFSERGEVQRAQVYTPL